MKTSNPNNITLSKLITSRRSYGYSGQGSQVIDLGKDIIFNNKEYILQIPFKYYLNSNNQTRVTFSISRTLLQYFPKITILEDEYALTTAYDAILTVARVYKEKQTYNSIIMKVIQEYGKKLIQEGYLIEKNIDKKDSIIKVDLSLDGEDIFGEAAFDDFASGKESLLDKYTKRPNLKRFRDVQVISKEQILDLREKLGVSNLALSEPKDLRNMLSKNFGENLKGIRELDNYAGRNYYIKIMISLSLKEQEKGKLTLKEKNKIIEECNEIFDTFSRGI